MANVINKNKLNPVNAEYLTQALSVKAAKELPYSWTFGDQGLLLDALADAIKTEPDCPFQSAKSVNKFLELLTCWSSVVSLLFGWINFSSARY